MLLLTRNAPAERPGRALRAYAAGTLLVFQRATSIHTNEPAEIARPASWTTSLLNCVHASCVTRPGFAARAMPAICRNVRSRAITRSEVIETPLLAASSLTERNGR